MKIYTVLSRDSHDFIHTTTDEGEAEFVKKEQMRDEEMAGGRPSVYIRESTLDEIKIEKFSEGYGQGLEHGDAQAINNKITQKAFEDGRLYEAGELELDTEGKDSAFQAWLEIN